MPRRRRCLARTLETIPQEETEKICDLYFLIYYGRPAYNGATLLTALGKQFDTGMGAACKILRGGQAQTDPSRPDLDTTRPRSAQDRMIAEAGFEWDILTSCRPATDPDALTHEAKPGADYMQKAHGRGLPVNLNRGVGCT